MYTPGPWKVSKEYGINRIEPIAGGRPVANANDQVDNDDDNARLIASAPELLESLKECEELLRIICTVVCPDNPPPYGQERLLKAQQAITKAEGKG